MKKMISLFLSASLLLALLPACQETAAPSDPPGRQLTALEVVNAMLPVSGYEYQPGMLEYLNDEGNGAEYLAVYLENAYGLSEGTWQDAAIIRAIGASAFELAVLRLENENEAARITALLTSYRFNRQGDFAGYAPAQADMVANGDTIQSGPYAALCICPSPDQAITAFAAAVNGNLSVMPAATPGQPHATPGVEANSEPIVSEPAVSEPIVSEPPTTETPVTGPPATEPPATEPPVTEPPATEPPATEPPATEPPAPTNTVYYPNRYPFVQPNKDDMSIYDISAILAAWEAGDLTFLSSVDKKIYDAAKNVLNKVLRDGMSDVEKETAVYNWMVNNINYDWTHQDVMRETPRESFTPYGGLVNRTAVCLGYATTFQLLMDLAGIECITVVGAAHASREDHGWNMVRLNGNWYCVDVTWDANSRERRHTSSQEKDWKFFNITSDEMAATDHQWDYANVPEAVTKGNGRS